MPREIVPGSYWLVTRRCLQRVFMLRPDDDTTRIFEYCLAEAASRFSIRLIGWLLMSNHYHAVLYDPLGELPAFLQHLHRLTAKAFNARYKRRENFWSSEETSLVRLITLEDVFEKVVYVLTNPVAANLVDSTAHWPGSSSLNYLDGQSKSLARPEFYFAKDGTMPLDATLRTQPPEGVDEETWAARLRARIAQVEADARSERLKSGQRVLGRQRVLATSPFDAPSSQPETSSLRPSVSSIDPSLRELALKHIKAFRAWYRRARREFVAGDRTVEFPPGTYRMRQLGARCAPFPADYFPLPTALA